MKELDAEAIALFARKGREGGLDVPQVGNANAVKVRRVMQLTRDLAGRPFSEQRILDLGCGEGAYAIEAANHGAQVVAVDARPQRMEQGRACAKRNGVHGVEFVLDDVRRVSKDTYGSFDAVYLLGILYHLEAADAVRLIRRVREMCAGFVIIDTLVRPDPLAKATVDFEDYEGRWHREHNDDDSPALRLGRVLKSVDNTFSFRFTEDSLVRALEDAGFTSVLRASAPREPGKAADRITLVARSGDRVRLSTYPWINDVSEAEIVRRLGEVPRRPELTAWIERLFEEEAMLRMGHNQRAEDANLGLGWLYYALARIVRPSTAVVIGSWRGFVPMVIGRALQDNGEPGEVVFIDPSMADNQWESPRRVESHFARFGITNVRHHQLMTQEFVKTDEYRRLGPIGLVFIDGLHTEKQVRIDYRAFIDKLAPRGFVLFHDSMLERRSTMYGEEHSYMTRVKTFLEKLPGKRSLQLLDVPFGAGVTLLRKKDGEPPLNEGVEGKSE